MSVNDKDSLKEQIIASMADRLGRKMAESVFQCDIWPVLDAAMTAGELLVARNTQPTKTVPEAVEEWLEGTIAIIDKALKCKDEMSRGECITMIKQLNHSAKLALREIKIKNGTT